MTLSVTTESLAFGPFQLSPDSGLLLRDGAPVRVGRAGVRILEALLRQPGKVIGKDALIEVAWPDRAVEESNLSAQIRLLRRAVGVQWIATAPRVGYRFVPAKTETVAAATLPVIAVLPLTLLDGVVGVSADGMGEDLITALSRFKSFAIVARNSSFAYRGRAVDVRRVAAELGATFVLEGSLRQTDGGRLRVATQLIDGASGTHLWADTFETAPGLEDDVVGRIATSLEPAIQQAEMARSRRERPGSEAPYDLYLRGLGKMQTLLEAENAEAFALFLRALDSEPDNAMFLAGASEAIQHRLSVDWRAVTDCDEAACLALARRGIQHGGSDGTAMALFAMSLFNCREHGLGHETAKRALQLNPNSLMAVLILAITTLHWGELADAELLFQRALRLDPNDRQQAFVLTGLAHIEMARDNPAAALRWAERSLSVNNNFGATYWMLIAANALLERSEAARRYLARFRELAPEATVHSIETGAPLASRMAAIARGLRLAGLPERAGLSDMLAKT